MMEKIKSHCTGATGFRTPTKEEITEALRVAQPLSGAGCVYKGTKGLKVLLDIISSCSLAYV